MKKMMMMKMIFTSQFTVCAVWCVLGSLVFLVYGPGNRHRQAQFLAYGVTADKELRWHLNPELPDCRLSSGWWRKPFGHYCWLTQDSLLED